MWNPPSDAAPKDEDLRTFLLSLRCSASSHGKVFRYLSQTPICWVLFSSRQAAVDTLTCCRSMCWDRWAAPTRHTSPLTAPAQQGRGRYCLHPHDLARVGQGILDAIISGENASIPAAWIQDTLIWKCECLGQRRILGDYCPKVTTGISGISPDRETPCLLAIGIHGQWLYIDLKRQIVIVKLSSQAEPVNEALDAKLIRFFSQSQNQSAESTSALISRSAPRSNSSSLTRNKLFCPEKKRDLVNAGQQRQRTFNRGVIRIIRLSRRVKLPQLWWRAKET